MKLPPYPKTKPSGIAWLGEVPEHWEVKRFGYLFRFFSGGTPSTSESDLWDGELPWVSSKDMKLMVIADTEDHISEAAVKQSATCKLPAGSLLIVNRSGILKHSIPAAIIAREMAINQDIRGCVPLSGVDSKFIAYLIQGNQPALLALWRQQGATVESLTFESVKTSNLLLPTLPEQRAIASFLDRETGRIDRLVAKKRELIERLKEKRTALISRTVTRGLPPAAAKAAGLPANPPLKPSALDWLGDIPKHWEVKRLSYLFRFSSRGTPPTETAEYWAGDLPWVSPKDMKCFHLSDTIDHVSELALRETSTTAVLPETMLLVARSGILKHSIPVAITTRRMTINQDIKGVTPLRKDTSVYYYAWFIEGHQSALLTEWRKEGATVESLELERVKNCALPFPPPRTSRHRRLPRRRDGQAGRAGGEGGGGGGAVAGIPHRPHHGGGHWED